MEIMYFFIGVAILGSIAGATVFFIALRSGQFDDLEGPAYRILYDDDDPMIPANRKQRGGMMDLKGAAQSDLDSPAKES